MLRQIPNVFWWLQSTTVLTKYNSFWLWFYAASLTFCSFYVILLHFLFPRTWYAASLGKKSRKEASVLNLIATEDPKNKGRKRKICVSCHSRLEELVSVSMLAFCISRTQALQHCEQLHLADTGKQTFRWLGNGRITLVIGSAGGEYFLDAVNLS